MKTIKAVARIVAQINSSSFLFVIQIARIFQIKIVVASWSPSYVKRVHGNAARCHFLGCHLLIQYQSEYCKLGR